MNSDAKFCPECKKKGNEEVLSLDAIRKDGVDCSCTGCGHGHYWSFGDLGFHGIVTGHGINDIGFKLSPNLHHRP